MENLEAGDKQAISLFFNKLKLAALPLWLLKEQAGPSAFSRCELEHVGGSKEDF